MAIIPDGCQLIARQIRESKIWVEKPAWWFKVWVHIILDVQHTSDEFYQRGTAMFNYKQIKKDCHLHGIEAYSIDHLIHWLRQEGMIATRKAIRGIVITVIKYEHFQNIDNYKSETKSETKSDFKSETEARRKRDYIYNKDKNVKNKEEAEPSIETASGSAPTVVLTKPKSKAKSKDEPKRDNYGVDVRGYIINTFSVLYQAKTGKVYPRQYGKDEVSVYNLLAAYEGKIDLIAFTNKFFAMWKSTKDKWLMAQAPTVTLMFGQKEKVDLFRYQKQDPNDMR